MNNNKRIALTIDDLPFVSLSTKDRSREGLEITNLLLKHLKQNDVRATGFVIGGKAGKGEKDDLLGKWHLDGHLLANHTFSHPSLSNISFDDFEKEVIQSEEVLAPYLENKTGKYFRFPYLDYGNTPEKRKKALTFLNKRSYTIAPVTLDSKDYIHNKIYVGAWLKEETDTMQYAIDKYLDYTKKIVEFHERQAMYFWGRTMGFIMLIHANKLNAYSLGHVIKLLKRKGYEFVSLSEVLNEPDYRQNYANIYNPKYMSWKEQSGNGKLEMINFPNVAPEILEVYNRKLQY